MEIISSLARAELMAEKLRREPYHLFTNDCISKSFRLKKLCRQEGISATVVICLGYYPGHFRSGIPIPVIHGWGEVESKRIETSRPLGNANSLGIIPINIKPLISVRF